MEKKNLTEIVTFLQFTKNEITIFLLMEILLERFLFISTIGAQEASENNYKKAIITWVLIFNSSIQIIKNG